MYNRVMFLYPHIKRSRHGHAKTGKPSREYVSWVSMKSRCLNSKETSYKYYGARGIRVCERWMKFENFLADMGPRPPTLTLGRIDNDGNYEPENCRWQTWSQQNRNRRRSSVLLGTMRGIETRGICELHNRPFPCLSCRGQKGGRVSSPKKSAANRLKARHAAMLRWHRKEPNHAGL